MRVRVRVRVRARVHAHARAFAYMCNRSFKRFVAATVSNTRRMQAH